VITLGLFVYELHGIKRCRYLIRVGEKLEAELKTLGQFRVRPHKVLGFGSEPVASTNSYQGAWRHGRFLALR
jgi:hypothetical protein